MFLTDSASKLLFRSVHHNAHAYVYLDIKEVLFFPAMKPTETQANTTGAGGPAGQV